MDELLSAVQWPAMAITLVAAYLVASQSKRKRAWGFWCFIASNVLWVVWGWHDKAYALIALQLGLFALNVRGARKNETV
jgi:TctA family transporter